MPISPAELARPSKHEEDHRLCEISKNHPLKHNKARAMPGGSARNK